VPVRRLRDRLGRRRRGGAERAGERRAVDDERFGEPVADRPEFADGRSSIPAAAGPGPDVADPSGVSRDRPRTRTDGGRLYSTEREATPMVSRLVLGCGAVGQRIVEAAADWSGSLRVVTEEDDRVEAIRSENIRAEGGDPTDPGTVAAFGPVDVVLVAEADPARARRIVAVAREAHPDATLVAYVGPDAGEEDAAALSAAADRTIDAGAVLGSTVADLVTHSSGLQSRRLRNALRSVEGTLAVVMHDNPDPDAIASAVALVRLAGVVGVDAVPCYYGSINHQENRALVNLLDLELRRLSPDEDLSEFGGFALVDHSRPGVNDQLPPELTVDVVIDHHPPREPVDGRFVDLRSEVGATSTLLTNYLQQFGVDDCGGRVVATALLYGIRVDTADFSREVTTADFEAAAALLPHSDGDLLDRVESPAVSPDTLNTLGRAIRNRDVRGSALASCVGPVNDRDALAQAADRLLDLQGVSTTLVYGYEEDDAPPGDGDGSFPDGTVYVSARARGTTLDLGETLRLAFDDLGSAGGHADMAGAQLRLSALGRDILELDGDERTAAVEAVVSETFFDAVEERPREVPRDGSPDAAWDGTEAPDAAGPDGAGE
jgi:nanoRNase/pAp phosphatase (c-di-AMP/oligoRNAs hydrolase)